MQGSGFGTLAENVADTQGLKLAFRAMRRQVEPHIEALDERLRNRYDVETNKLFFKAFANVSIDNLKIPKNKEQFMFRNFFKLKWFLYVIY